MPKTLWLPGGKGGGGKQAVMSPSVELKEVGGQWMVAPTPKFISDCKEQGRSEVTRQVAYAEYAGILQTRAEYEAMATIPDDWGYPISRPVVIPSFSAPETPVQRVSWWETIDSTTSFFVTVVALILIVLVAMVVRGVAW